MCHVPPTPEHHHSSGRGPNVQGGLAWSQLIQDLANVFKMVALSVAWRTGTEKS